MSFFSGIWDKLVENAGAIGTAIGSYFGGPVGGAAGGTIGGMISDKWGNEEDPPGPMFGDQLPPVTVTGQRPPSEPGFDWSKFPWGSAIGALGGLGSGAINYYGGSAANQANAEQAQKQMDFQKMMSDTSWQRGVKDMKAAGLNPMLAYSQGGASSAAGAAARMENVAGPAANSALSAAQAITSMENTHAQTSNLNAQTAFTDSNTVLNEIRGRQMEADIHRTRASASRETAEESFTRARTPGAEADSRVSRRTEDARISTARYGATTAGGTAAKAEAEGEFWRSTYGQAAPYVERLLGQLGSIFGSAKDVAGIIKPRPGIIIKR
ncbi:MAG: DNA pilot protein [Microviridae sp.]|nr:MAG: DNA pilot protein [Microviridae sp.]